MVQLTAENIREELSRVAALDSPHASLNLTISVIEAVECGAVEDMWIDYVSAHLFDAVYNPSPELYNKITAMLGRVNHDAVLVKGEDEIAFLLLDDDVTFSCGKVHGTFPHSYVEENCAGCDNLPDFYYFFDLK